jgi:phage gp36-like protein
VHGRPLAPPNDDTDAPESWVWLTVWTIDKCESATDDDGWQYCHKWSLWPSLWHANGHDGADNVRRRRWYRLRQCTLWRKDPAPQNLQRDALDLHRRRSRRKERGARMLERVESEMREVAKAAVRERMEETIDISAIDGHEDQPDYVLATLETSPEELRMRDADALDDSCFAEAVADEGMLIQIYIKCVACLVGGRLQNPDERVPAVLTENGCLILKNALISESLQDDLRDSDLLQEGIVRSLAQEAELQRQLGQLDNHLYYTPDAFLTEGAGAGKPFAAWKLGEQMRLERLLANYQSRDLFQGQIIFRCHAASGLQKGQHVACRVRIGPHWECQTQVVTVDAEGVATWDTDLVCELDGDPALMGTIQHLDDGTEKAFPDCVIFEVMRTGGPHHHGDPNVVAGSSRHDNTRQLWCPAPHFRPVDVEVECGWKTAHGHTKHGTDKESHAFLSVQVQYSFRAKEINATAANKSEDPHKEFRMLSRRLGECLEDESTPTSANAGFTWLLDVYAEYYGIGSVYRRLFELRVSRPHFVLLGA